MPLFLRSNILPFDMPYWKAVGIFMHDIDHDFAPLNLMNVFALVILEPRLLVIFI